MIHRTNQWISTRPVAVAVVLATVGIGLYAVGFTAGRAAIDAWMATR